MTALSAVQTFGDLVVRAGPLIGLASDQLIDDSDTPSVWTEAGQMLANMVDACQQELYDSYSWPGLRARFPLSTIAGAVLYDIPGVSDGTTTWGLNLDRIREVWVIVGTQWIPLEEGIYPANYTNTGERYPCLFQRRFDATTGTERIEVWPAPDAVYTVNFIGDRNLPDATDPATAITLAPKAVYAQFMAQAKAHFNQPDAGLYAGRAREALSAVRAQSHGVRRYIQGTRPTVPRTMPKIAQS